MLRRQVPQNAPIDLNIDPNRWLRADDYQEPVLPSVWNQVGCSDARKDFVDGELDVYQRTAFANKPIAMIVSTIFEYRSDMVDPIITLCSRSRTRCCDNSFLERQVLVT
jgi:hypothetical protein